MVDPNVFISAQISSLGHPARIARAAEGGSFELVVSERLLAELRGVLLRPRFRRYMPESEVENLISNLRESRGVTQTQLAGSLGVSQPNVSKIERKDDVHLSTLGSYVAALGGRLEVKAVFPDHPEQTVSITLPGSPGERTAAER